MELSDKAEPPFNKTVFLNNDGSVKCMHQWKLSEQSESVWHCIKCHTDYDLQDIKWVSHVLPHRRDDE